MSESKEEVEQQQQQTTDVGTPTKRTPKRKADELFKKESEELLKTLGVSMDMEDGRRRTRSSARGATPTTTTPATPPSKRARGATTTKPVEESKSPNAAATTPKKRGGGVQGERKRLLVLMDPALPKEYTDNVSPAENDEMDATDSTATVAEEEDDDAGKAQDATESKDTDKKDEVVKENDLKEDGETKKEEVLSDKKGEEKATDDVTDSVTKLAENAAAKDEVPAKVVEVKPATDIAPNTECLEEKKTDGEAMEVDVEQGKKDEVQTNDTKSDDTKKEEVVVVEAVCESNGSNTNITPKKLPEPEAVKPDVVENDKQQPASTASPIKTDSTVVVEAAPPPSGEETKVDENNSTAKEEDKDTTTVVNNVTDAKDVEKVVTPIEVEAKIVTSEGTATTIEPSPTPE